MKRYKVLHSTAQIFAPYNCTNNCEFCLLKSFYSLLVPNKEEVLASIRKLNNSPLVKTYIFTGGEPLTNFNAFKEMVNTAERDIHLITTLPVSNNLDQIIEYINNEPKITKVTISRHLGYEFSSSVASIEYLNKFTKDVAINCVINGNFDKTEFQSFCDYFIENVDHLIYINLRQDINNVNFENLHVSDEYNTMLESFSEFWFNSQCEVCNVDTYKYRDSLIRYHKIIHNMVIEQDGYTQTYAPIISPDGRICKTFEFEDDEDFGKYICEGVNTFNYVIKTEHGYTLNNTDCISYSKTIIPQTIFTIDKYNNEIIDLFDFNKIKYEIIDIEK